MQKNNSPTRFEISENKLNELRHILYTKMDEITLLKDQIRQAENQLQYVCSLDGHNIVTERDPGMYGELFRTCTKCKVSF
jgi:hypothetical protein